jgi:hypothetical protein
MGAGRDNEASQCRRPAHSSERRTAKEITEEGRKAIAENLRAIAATRHMIGEHER